ncbi:MAG: hypothetical protein JKY15_01225 [Deltaproteobacteria bacterium]|nr:hypothetical protein [Deltaproteobacteria bacterium]
MMKKLVNKIVVALFVGVFAVPAAAQFNSSPTDFIPTPSSEDEPLYFFVGLSNANLFSGGKAGPFTPNGQVGLMNLQLQTALIYNVGFGLDVGFGLHGGVQSPYGMFFGSDTPADRAGTHLKRYGAMFGADVMVRYLGMISDMFYAGLQAQVGYNYTDNYPGATDADIKTAVTDTSNIDGQVVTRSLGPWDSKGAFNSFIPVVIGIPMGVVFEGGTVLYWFPAIELGQTTNRYNKTLPTVANADKSVWKSAVGAQLNVGVEIPIGSTKLVINLKPRVASFSNEHSWGLDLNTGASWEF